LHIAVLRPQYANLVIVKSISSKKYPFFMRKLVKCINVLLLSACTGAVSYGKAVDENTAKTIGSNYLISDGVPGVNSATDLITSYTATVQLNGKVVVDYYVFNINGGTGFVMVSGDDNVLPILAYSRESSFDVNNISPSEKSWIEGYQNQITAVISDKIQADAATIKNWNDLKIAKKRNVTNDQRTTSSITFPSSTLFLLATQWNQTTGYNTYCPGGDPTGCVATCMSEVMQYWNWPTVGTGSHTYTQAPGYGYPAQTADFGNTAYNWASMNASLTGGNTAIATLMYHAGVSVNMDYTPTAAGSGSYVISLESPIMNCAEYAMKTYFHYKPTLRGIPRYGEYYLVGGVPTYYVDSIPQATWISMLETELNAQRPVIYSGQEPADAGGHCWVCDGYNSTNMFHFNWGWGGLSNGYFTVNNLHPSALGTGAGSGNFNADQCAIIGIMPDSFPSVSGNIKLLAHLNCTTSQGMPYDGGFSIVTKILNSNTTSFTGDYAAQVFDTLGNMVGTIETFTSQAITAGDSLALTFSTTGMYLLIPADYYYVRIMYRQTGTTTWAPVANNGVFINYNVLDVENSQSLELTAAINIVTPGGTSIVANSAFTFGTQLSNYDSGTLNCTVQAVLINVATGASFTVQQYTGQSFPGQSSFSYTFHNTSITVPVGTYVLAVQHQPNSTGSFIYTGSDYFENPIIVNVVHALSVNTPAQVADKIQVYPNPANDVINIDFTGVDISVVTITDIQGRQLQKFAPGSGQSAISIPVSNLAPGVYFANLQAGSDVITKKIVVTR